MSQAFDPEKRLQEIATQLADLKSQETSLRAQLAPVSARINSLQQLQHAVQDYLEAEKMVRAATRN